MARTTPADDVVDRTLRHGWLQLGVFLALGLVLESLHLVKLPFYLDHRLRRDLWTLAHAHGALLGLVTVVLGLCLTRVADPARRATVASLVRVGSLVVPVGFLLGGIGNAEGDPSLAILLTPAGALILLAGLVLFLRGLAPGG